jgi:hypothetical protein
MMRMHELLPREIGDMIYGHLLTMEKPLFGRAKSMASIVKAWKIVRPNQLEPECEHGWQPESDDPCPCFPYMIRPDFVGMEVAREIVEAWYLTEASPGYLGVSKFDRKHTEKAVCEDVFRVKLDPATVFRAFTLTCTISELGIGTE